MPCYADVRFAVGGPSTQEATGAWASLVGCPDERVFVASNMKSSTESNPTKYDYGPEGANFIEQYQ